MPRNSRPASGKMHECCLGLAHAPTLAASPTAFVVVQPVVVSVERPFVALDALAPVGIRDGPSQPHGPPSLV